MDAGSQVTDLLRGLHTDKLWRMAEAVEKFGADKWVRPIGVVVRQEIGRRAGYPIEPRFELPKAALAEYVAAAKISMDTAQWINDPDMKSLFEAVAAVYVDVVEAGSGPVN